MVSRHRRARHPDPGAGRRRGAHPARARRQVQPGDRRATCRASGWATTCSPAPPRATTTRSSSSCSWRCTATATWCRRTDDGRDQPVDRAHAARPLRRGHLPDLRLRRRARRPVRQLRQPARPGRPDQPAVEDQRRGAEVRRDRALLPRPARRSPKSLGSWLATRTDWRPNVLKFAANLVDDLKPRAITRDLDWGVPVPARRLARPADEAALRLVRRGDRLPVGVGRVGPARAGPGRLEAVVDRPGRPGLLLHGQGQHRLPLGDLAGAAARARTGRATTAATPGRVRHAEPARRDRVVGVPDDERLEVLHQSAAP